jgi:hypothetical protein
MHELPLVFYFFTKMEQIQEEQQCCACLGNSKTERPVLRETKSGLSQSPRLLSKKFLSFTTSLGMASLSTLISWRSLSLPPQDSILEVLIINHIIYECLANTCRISSGCIYFSCFSDVMNRLNFLREKAWPTCTLGLQNGKEHLSYYIFLANFLFQVITYNNNPRNQKWICVARLVQE